MDHHCAFLHNCVGADNLSDFVVFLFSVCAGTWFVVIYAVFELIATYSWRGGGDLGKDELSRFIRSSRFSPGVVTTMAVFRQSAATRDGGLVLIAAVSLGIALGVGILLWIYASLAKTGATLCGNQPVSRVHFFTKSFLGDSEAVCVRLTPPRHRAGVASMMRRLGKHREFLFPHRRDEPRKISA